MLLGCVLHALCCTGAAVVNARKVGKLAAAGTVQCWCCWCTAVAAVAVCGCACSTEVVWICLTCPATPACLPCCACCAALRRMLFVYAWWLRCVVCVGGVVLPGRLPAHLPAVFRCMPCLLARLLCFSARPALFCCMPCFVAVACCCTALPCCTAAFPCLHAPLFPLDACSPPHPPLFNVLPLVRRLPPRVTQHYAMIHSGFG